jgi:hypothetical protein
MGLQVTFNWPLNIGASFTSASLPGAVRGIAPLTPNANNQVTADTSVWPLSILLAAGFTIAIGVNTTANRPTGGLSPGLPFFDSTLGIPIWRNATNTGWVNASGATV